MWARAPEYSFQERFDGREGMGIVPAAEFPFVEGSGTQAAERAGALARWAQATAEHHGYRPYAPPALPYAPMPPGYQAPFAYGLYGNGGAPALNAGGLLRLAFLGLGGLMAYRGLTKKKRRGEALLGAAMLYAGLGLPGLPRA